MIDFSKGLIPVVVQEVNTKEVLMLAYMNKEAFELTKKKWLCSLFFKK